MIVLLTAYKWTIFGALLGGGALTLIGTQLASRNQSVQTLVVSQAAALGTVLGLAASLFFTDDHLHQQSLVPLLCSFTLAFLFYLICEIVVSHQWPSRNTYYVGLFGLLLSANYVMISLIPGLETHMAASYFGDLAVASDFDSLIMAVIGGCSLIFFAKFWTQVTAASFDSAIFGVNGQNSSDKKIQRLFIAISLVTIAASIQLLGLLFTIACLFLPAMVLARTRMELRGMAQRLAAATFLGIALGFGFSLWHGRVPTVPSIAAALLLSSFLLGIDFKRRSRQN